MRQATITSNLLNWPCVAFETMQLKVGKMLVAKDADELHERIQRVVGESRDDLFCTRHHLGREAFLDIMNKARA